MIIEFETYNQLKEILKERGYYLVKKPKAIGKLNNCAICGRKISQGSLRDYVDEDTKERGRYLECRSCHRGVYVLRSDDVYTKHDLDQEVAQIWNKLNKGSE